jgi:hypothetical protein
MTAGPKTRWVDGTPEYSFHICGLRKLFPEARFVHVFRDVRAVVRSMVNFHRVAGLQLVTDEAEAYRYWIRTVSACLLAERAYGSAVVHRVRYTDLVNESEPTMRSLFNFLGESYTERCLEPLQVRINSSTVPADYQPNDPPTNAVIFEEAMQLSGVVEKTCLPVKSSSAANDQIESAFRERVTYMATLDGAYQTSQRMIESLNKSGA